MQNPTESQVDMGDVHGFGEAQDDGAGQLGTGSLVLTAAEHDVVIVEADVKVLDTAAGSGMRSVGTQKLESHGLWSGYRAGNQMAVGRRS